MLGWRRKRAGLDDGGTSEVVIEDGLAVCFGNRLGGHCGKEELACGLVRNWIDSESVAQVLSKNVINIKRSKAGPCRASTQCRGCRGASLQDDVSKVEVRTYQCTGELELNSGGADIERSQLKLHT